MFYKNRKVYIYLNPGGLIIWQDTFLLHMLWEKKPVHQEGLVRDTRQYNSLFDRRTQVVYDCLENR